MISPSQLTQTIRQFMDFAMHHSMREHSHFAKMNSISIPQLGILMQLHYHRDCGISDIGERFDITSAAASQLADKLVQSGLIQRMEDPNDRRAKLLNLTDKGRQLIQHGIQERYRWVDRLAAKLTAEERAKVDEALEILTQAAREVETESIQPTT
jgi:DNA-binding MarR family transcriptional regulator